MLMLDKLPSGTLQAKRMLKNMRIKTRHRNMEFKIIGISELPCHQQTYVLNNVYSYVIGVAYFYLSFVSMLMILQLLIMLLHVASH